MTCPVGAVTLAIVALSIVPAGAGSASPAPPQQGSSATTADLVQTQLIVPKKVKIGKTFQVIDELENAGEFATPVCLTLYYLSAEDTFDQADRQVGGRRVPALAVGRAHSMVANVTLKDAVPPGEYYFIAVADGTREVQERYETNNVRATKVTVQPADAPKK